MTSALAPAAASKRMIGARRMGAVYIGGPRPRRRIEGFACPRLCRGRRARLCPMSEAAPLMVGVSGLRGIVGKSLTPEVAARFARAFGTWLNERDTGGRVVIGRD